VLRRYNAVAVQHLLAACKRRGYVTYDKANSVPPKSGVSAQDMQAAVVEAIYDLGFE
jgi:hypothetical protein